jgi:DNA-binding CsgD family transcriptional regulator
LAPLIGNGAFEGGLIAPLELRPDDFIITLMTEVDMQKTTIGDGWYAEFANLVSVNYPIPGIDGINATVRAITRRFRPRLWSRRRRGSTAASVLADWSASSSETVRWRCFASRCPRSRTGISDRRLPPRILSPTIKTLSSLFHLTAAEARLASRLFRGATLTDAAAEFGVGKTTVEAHLKAILSKTNTNRQAELIARCRRSRGSTLLRDQRFSASSLTASLEQ